jgi:hypothetical protein
MSSDDTKDLPAIGVAHEAHHAPIVFFDNAATLAHFQGVVAVSLSAITWQQTDGPGPRIEQMMVAHLRTTVQGAISLRDAINSALLLAAPAKSEASN